MTPAQCRAARALLRWTVKDLARESLVGEDTINRFEAESRPNRTFRPRTLRSLQDALERAGVKFLDDHDGVGLRK